MFELLILPSTVRCDHDGRIKNENSQDWVTLDGHPVLRAEDPEGREIDWCPNRGADVKRCSTTERVEKGYSNFVTLDGKPVVLASLDGKTNGTPPKAVHYRVRDPRQRYVVVGS